MLRGPEGLAPALVGRHARRDDAWYYGKMTQRTIPQTNSVGRKPTRAGSDIYTDIVGSFPVLTREGYMYFVLCKCFYTQHVSIYLPKIKGQLLGSWKQYIKDMRSFSGASAGCVPIAPGYLHYPEDPQFCISDDGQVYVELGGSSSSIVQYRSHGWAVGYCTLHPQRPPSRTHCSTDSGSCYFIASPLGTGAIVHAPRLCSCSSWHQPCFHSCALLPRPPEQDTARAQAQACPAHR